MTSCDDLRNSLADLVFGEPTPEDELRLNRHLAACPECRDEERRLLDLRDALRGEACDAGADLRARIHAALPHRGAPGPLAWLRHPVPAYVVALVCLLGLAAAWAASRGHRPALAHPERGARVSSLAVAGQEPGFRAAGSYDTGVMLARPAQSPRDSARRRGLLRDSL